METTVKTAVVRAEITADRTATTAKGAAAVVVAAAIKVTIRTAKVAEDAGDAAVRVRVTTKGKIKGQVVAAEAGEGAAVPAATAMAGHLTADLRTDRREGAADRDSVNSVSNSAKAVADKDSYHRGSIHNRAAAKAFRRASARRAADAVAVAADLVVETLAAEISAADKVILAAVTSADAAALAVAAVVRAASAAATLAAAREEVAVVGNRTRHARGMTIMELLLALSLSSLVLYLVGMAIDLQWRLMDSRRSHVEETILARSVLRRIADDLRGAVLFSPPDLAGLDAIADNPLASGATDPAAAAAALTGGATQTPMDTPVGTGAAGQNNQTAPPTEEAGAADAAQQQPQASIVGLYGTQTWLAIDLSRLPRIDEYDALLQPAGSTTPLDIPSDVKTVTYFIADATLSETGEEEFGPSAADAVAGRGNVPAVQRGLIRQQMSKAMSSQNELAQVSDTDTGSQILAEEITGLEFAYYDGLDWYTDWNSQDMGGLPVAVAIAVQVEMKASHTAARAAAANEGADAATARETSLHRLIVQLPAARKFGAAFAEQNAAVEEAAAASEAEAAAADGSAGGAQGAAGGTAPATGGAGS